MAYIWKFDAFRMQDVFIFDPDIDSNFQTFAICLFFIAQWAVKSYIIANKWIFAIMYNFTAFWAIKIKQTVMFRNFNQCLKHEFEHLAF